MPKEIEPKYLLALNAHQHIGSQTIKKVLAAVGNPAELWQRGISILNGKIEPKIVQYVREVLADISPEEEIKKLQKYDVGFVTIYDKKYPRFLKESYDAPVVLYIRGDIDVLESPSLAVVGSRRFSEYGKSIAYQFSKECAAAGLTIVSGLALGIDAEAHQAALDVGGKTVGVLGCGLDRIYPVANFHLGQEIVKSGGAVVSEYPLGTPPLKFNFPLRNRIIAGLSKGVLVIEAAQSSGALITAYQALEYNRDVFAVPGNIDSANSVGTNKLIQNGAKLVTSSADILSEYDIESSSMQKEAKKILPENADERKIYEVIKSDPLGIDKIIELTGLNIIAVNSALSTMEIKGTAKNVGAGRYKSIL